MLLLTFSLVALLSSTQSDVNGSLEYVECYDNIDCRNYYDKLYCYAGTCTDRCPPGYVQENSGAEPTFTCKCNREKGFKTNGYFPGNYSNVTIPKCTCTEYYCQVTVYATGIGYTDGLIPLGSPPNCKIQTDGAPQVTTMFVLYMVVGTMLVFAFLNCRSASCVVYDFHRYIGLYVIGSIAVIVFVLTVTPFTAGFTRSMGFGVIIHNSAEWNFILRLHFGKQSRFRNCTSMCVMLYYVLLLLAMVVLPLEILFYVAMVQGGFLDWTLVFFLCEGCKRIPKDEPNWQPFCNYCCSTSYLRFSVWYGIAALSHLLTVQVLFVGFALNHPVLIGAGSVLLVPTFLAYTYWAYGEDRLSLLCGPSLVVNYESLKGKPGYTLVPFEHTSSMVDMLWQVLYWGSRTNSTAAGSADIEDNNKEKVELLNPVKGVVVDDCENFKFGVHGKIKKCPCGGPCCTWIPCYWLLALVIVILNATLIIYVPKLSDGDRGCITGFDYGAW
jgi:hypothetical protein